jgi:flagellar basal body-associated protein FliL
MPQMQPMAVPTPQAMPAGTKKRGKSLVLLLILGGLFLAAVVLILFFALKH